MLECSRIIISDVCDHSVVDVDVRSDDLIKHSYSYFEWLTMCSC